MRVKPLIILSGLALVLVAIRARAELTFQLASPLQSALGSNNLSFTGTLTNTSPTENLFLNNPLFNFTDAATNYFTGDTNAFFANVPGILQPGETYTDNVFGISIAAATPPGQYSGTITLQGGADIFAATNLASQTFQITLPPASLGVVLSGTNLILSWPSPPGDFVLQANSDLTTTNWVVIVTTPTLTNGQNQVSVPTTNGNQFFRLEYP